LTGLAVLAAAVVAYALVSRRLETTIVSAPMFFVGIGILVGPHSLGLLSVDVIEGSGLVLAEVALAFVLFTDAATVDFRSLRSPPRLPARLLGVGTPLTIALGVAAGALLLTEIEFWEAAIVAAVLAPTDAALGKAVVSSSLVPARIRRALNVEAGLNDGLSVPFLALFLALAVEATDLSPRSWFAFAAEQIGYGAVIGGAVGLVGAWLVAHAARRELMTVPFQQLSVLALATLAFVLADAAGGNGFIAAFVGGLAAGAIGTFRGGGRLSFLEQEGELLSLAVFFLFGVASLELLAPVGWEIVAYAALSLTLVRMVPVAICAVGSGLRTSDIAFLGWFGPRGLASIVLALTVAEEEPHLPGLEVLLATMTVTVLASVVLHGVSANPLARVYGGRAGSSPPPPEMSEADDSPPRGRSDASP
jgi:sodium/hydrogen antiporter